MSIPMSCAGCGAAFDVPDNLAGKTIRCTSCKAQMSVPAGGGEAKKPFGSGSQNGAKAAQGAAVAAAPAKTSPNGKPAEARPAAPAKAEAKPASKPAAKAVAVEVDDEDEEEKGGKGAKSKPAKGGDKKAVAKKRRDDDDDDDEDERPTRKKPKNKSGGSGAMIAIIGGVLGLILIVVLGVVLLGGGEKKDESASNSSSSSEPAKTPGPGAMGGMQGPGAGGGPSSGPTYSNPNMGMYKPPASNGADPAAGGMNPGPGGAGAAPGGMTPGSGPMYPGPGGMYPGGTYGPPNPGGMGPGTPAPGGMNGNSGPMYPGPGGMYPGGTYGPPNPGGMNPAPGGMAQGPGDATAGPFPGAYGPNSGAGPGLGGGTPANTDANQKARIEPFLAVAFDPDQKDLFTVEVRPAGRTTERVLHHYSYPTFQSIGAYKMASNGFRVAIDTKGGLLYVAAAKGITTFDAQPTDRIGAVGNVEVYDLKAVREHKNPDGKPLEDGKKVEPVATITVNHRIHGLEVSEDGKSLYVLHSLNSTGATGKKAALTLYDTATRKESKRYEQFTDGVAVRDMVKTADGKSNLIVTEAQSTKDKSTTVVVIDAANMSKLQTTKFREVQVLDVAPMSDGGMVVSTVSASQAGRPNPGGAPGGMFGGKPGGMGSPPGPGGPGGIPGIGGPMGGGPGAPFPGGPMGGQPGAPFPGGQPGGPFSGGQPGGGTQSQVRFNLVLVDPNGAEKGEMDLGVLGHVSNNGYVEFDPANKKLFTSTWRGSGLDVYEVTDPTAANGVKLQTAVRTARRDPFGGNFSVTPDGKYLVFQHGTVLDTSDIGGALAKPGTPGIPPGSPGANPGMGPGGFVPPNPGVPTPPGVPPMPGAPGSGNAPPGKPNKPGVSVGVPGPMPGGGPAPPPGMPPPPE